MSGYGYFVLTSSEDGIDIAGPMTEAMLLERISPDKDGDSYYGGTYPIHFLSELPDIDKGCFADDDERDGVRSVIVICGSIVVPKPKETVTKFSLSKER